MCKSLHRPRHRPVRNRPDSPWLPFIRDFALTLDALGLVLTDAHACRYPNWLVEMISKEFNIPHTIYQFKYISVDVSTVRVIYK